MSKKITTKQHTQDNKDILFDLLENEKIENFEVSFDGSGDSGQIENISLDGKILKKKVVGAILSAGNVWDPITKTTSQKWETDVDVEGLIQGICYEVLEDSFGGWEIDDGSYGNFNFDVKKRKMTLEMNERVMEVNTEEFTI
jgi:hypothetical protein